MFDSAHMIVRLHTLLCVIYVVACVISGAEQYEFSAASARAKGLELDLRRIEDCYAGTMTGHRTTSGETTEVSELDAM